MAARKQKKSNQTTKGAKKTGTPRRRAAPRPERGAAPEATPTEPLTPDEDAHEGADQDAGDASEGGEDEGVDEDGVDPREAAASRIGHSIHAHLEALHMSDRDGAIAAISTIVPVRAELAQVGADLETLGAADLARDVRLAVDRMERAR